MTKDTSALQQSIRELEHAKLVYETLVRDAVQPVLKYFAQMPDVSLILVVGYTPGFNDGEPCEHTTEAVINLGELYCDEWYERGISDLFEEADIEHIFDDFDLPFVSVYKPDPEEKAVYDGVAKEIEVATGMRVDPPEDELVRSAVNQVIVPALDREFGTDYAVLYVFRDGEVERYHTEYDCGY